MNVFSSPRKLEVLGTYPELVPLEPDDMTLLLTSTVLIVSHIKFTLGGIMLILEPNGKMARVGQEYQDGTYKSAIPTSGLGTLDAIPMDYP